MGTTSMDNRDPHNLNSHVQVTFDDVFGEPEGLRTPDGCWNCSEKCYDKTRECCYIFLVVIFAPCVAFCSACSFACVAFQQVWCVGPCLRLWKINFATCRKFWWGCLLGICGPCAEVMGLYFSKVKVQYQKIPDSENSKDDAAEQYFNV